MARKNIFVRVIGGAARRFRAVQEVWILPWWDSGGLAAAPLWALDALVLIVKLCSTCVVAGFQVLVPPVLKSMHGETILITGAGHGIGRELALQLSELGATVICLDSDQRCNNSVVDEIRSKDGEVACSCLISLYLLDSQSMSELLDTLIALTSNSSLKSTLRFDLSQILDGDIKAKIKEKIVNGVKIVLKTVVLVYACFVAGIGIALPMLEQIINFVGAFFYSILGLLIPCTIETVFRWDDLGRYNWILYKNILIFIIGSGSLISGCTVAIMDIIEISHRKTV